MRLFDMLDSGNCYKVRMMLARRGVAFERVEVDVDGGETRSPAFLAKNPYGKVPALEVEPGVFLAESNAILCFLAEGTEWLPAGGLDRARAMQWLFWEQYSHEPYVAVARHWIRHLEITPERAGELEARQARGLAALEVMERHLSRSPWLAPSGFGVADMALYAYTHVAEEGGFDLGPLPAVRDWLARVAARPGHVPMGWTG